MGVSFFIEWWAPHRNTVVSRQHRYNSPSYPTLSGEADTEGKFSGLIVKTAELHDGVDSFGHASGQDRLVVERAGALVR